MTIAELTAPASPLTWQILSTPPMTGANNMAYDIETLEKMQAAGTAPVLRFFFWDGSGVSYGKHQSPNTLTALIPAGLAAVQRPTGGGLVFHGQDLCLSLCWRAGQPPMPSRLKDHYAWIHSVIWEAIQPLTDAQLATCRDCSNPSTPFQMRDCFTEPVAYDIIRGQQKIVGGALCRKKNAYLYQGAIQGLTHSDLKSVLENAFLRALRTE